MDLDLVGILEAFYRLDLTGEAWLQAVLEAVQPLLDRDHLGIFGGFYEWRAPYFMSPGTILVKDLSDRLRHHLAEATLTMPRDYVAAALCSPAAVVHASDIPSWRDIPVVRGGMASMGVRDLLGFKAREADGTACWVGSFRSGRAPLPAREQQALAGVARHFAAAHRIQRKLCSKQHALHVEAILDARGRLCHAEPPARAASQREVLQRAAGRFQSARTKQRRSDVRSLSAWDALVAERWSIVEHFEHDGRKYLLAVENAALAPRLECLTERERAVVEQALQGLSNKAIGYELGIAHSTVKVLMARAASKLGVSSRAALLRQLRRDFERGSVIGDVV